MSMREFSDCQNFDFQQTRRVIVPRNGARRDVQAARHGRSIGGRLVQ